MWGYGIEDFFDILSTCDFSQAAINVFKKLHLTEAEKPISSTVNALTFVYNNLPPDLVLTKEERHELSSLSQMSHLFDITDFEEKIPFVRFFSVDLEFVSMNRSQTQYTIHSIIARKAPYCAIALFRHEGTVSLSVSFNDTCDIKSIFLSNWYSLYSVELNDFLAMIGTAMFSLKSGTEFISDFIYLTARDYYTHPLSYEYLRYQLNTDESSIAQIVEKYGNDYVADALVEADNAKIDTTYEFDFDLIEYELEQMVLDESEESDSDGFDGEYPLDTYFNSNDSEIPVASIPKDVLADPVLLLKWLDDHSPEKQSEFEIINTVIIDLINAENIDYIDHRDKGGRLWIFGGYELSEFALKCKEIGIEFHFKEGGGKATDGFDAWWCR